MIIHLNSKQQIRFFIEKLEVQLNLDLIEGNNIECVKYVEKKLSFGEDEIMNVHYSIDSCKKIKNGNR